MVVSVFKSRCDSLDQSCAQRRRVLLDSNEITLRRPLREGGVSHFFFCDQQVLDRCMDGHFINTEHVIYHLVSRCPRFSSSHKYVQSSYDLFERVSCAFHTFVQRSREGPAVRLIIWLLNSSRRDVVSLESTSKQTRSRKSDKKY